MSVAQTINASPPRYCTSSSRTHTNTRLSRPMGPQVCPNSNNQHQHTPSHPRSPQFSTPSCSKADACHTMREGVAAARGWGTTGPKHLLHLLLVVSPKQSHTCSPGSAVEMSSIMQTLPQPQPRPNPTLQLRQHPNPTLQLRQQHGCGASCKRSPAPAPALPSQNPTLQLRQQQVRQVEVAQIVCGDRALKAVLCPAQAA